MILFYNDWYKYPSAIIHENTKNETFLRLAALYKKMGVKNHAFILSLINPELQYVDPHSPDLTLEQMLAIGVECKMNPWYTLREVIRAPAESGNESVPFIANRGNISTFWLFFNHVFNILIQPRQTGKTFTLAVLINYLLNVATQNSKQVLLTKDDGLRAKTMDKIRDTEEAMPEFLIQRTKNDISNTSEIKIESLNNSITALVSSLSEKAALKVGRGFTSPIFYIDEAAFIPNISKALPAALAAGGAAREIAERNNSIYGTILTTTAGKKDDKDGKYVFNMLQESLIWNEKLLDCENLEDLRNTIRKNNNGILRINSTFSHRQLGYTDEWLKRRIEESVSEGQDAERDFLNKWTSGNISSPLDQDVLETIKNSEKDVVFTDLNKNGYILAWYIEENAIDTELNNKPYILGVDSSDAIGNDNIALILRSVYDGSVTMRATINETNIIDFCLWLCEFLVKYKKVTCIIERRSTGSSIIDYLLKMLPNFEEDPYKRLFNRIVNDREEHLDEFKMASGPLFRKNIDMLVQHKKYFGFATSASGITSRSELYGQTLKDCAKKTGHLVHDKKLINEISGLVVKNNRVDHDDGEHDDTVIAWLLSYWLMARGNNLDVYGIDRNSVLINNKDVKGIDDRDLKHDLEIRKEIDNLLEKIKNSNDENMSYIYEKQIKFLSTKIINKDYLSTDSVDVLLNKIKEEKNAKIYSNRPKQLDLFGNQNGYQKSYHTQSYLFGEKFF